MKALHRIIKYLVFYCFAGLALHCAAGAQFTDAQWVSFGDRSNGVDNFINVLTLDSSGNLYAGGWFHNIGGSNVNYIAKWDGKSWSPLGSGLLGSDLGAVGVYSLAFDKEGNLYAGGNFTNAGGVPVNYVARWDGTNWSALGTGQPSNVASLAFDKFGNLYATTYYGISVWNGSIWTPLQSQPNNGVVVALTFDASNNLYAAGYFTTIGGVNATNIAKWDGTNWSALGPGLGQDDPKTSDYPYNLAFDSHGNLYATGDFTNAGSMSVNCIAKWDGTNWSGLGAGVSVPQYDALGVNSITFDVSGNLYACGDFGMAGSVITTNIAKWDGKEWSALGSGLDIYGDSVVCDAKGNLYVGGEFLRAGTNSSAFIAKALLTSPLPNQLSLSNQPGGKNVVTFLGTPGADYELDFATNLAPPFDWTPQSTNTAPAGNTTTAGYLTFTNAQSSPFGFYRMRSVP